MFLGLIKIGRPSSLNSRQGAKVAAELGKRSPQAFRKPIPLTPPPLPWWGNGEEKLKEYEENFPIGNFESKWRVKAWITGKWRKNPYPFGGVKEADEVLAYPFLKYSNRLQKGRINGIDVSFSLSSDGRNIKATLKVKYSLEEGGNSYEQKDDFAVQGAERGINSGYYSSWKVVRTEIIFDNGEILETEGEFPEKEFLRNIPSYNGYPDSFPFPESPNSPDTEPPPFADPESPASPDSEIPKLKAPKPPPQLDLKPPKDRKEDDKSPPLNLPPPRGGGGDGRGDDRPNGGEGGGELEDSKPPPLALEKNPDRGKAPDLGDTLDTPDNNSPGEDTKRGKSPDQQIKLDKFPEDKPEEGRELKPPPLTNPDLDDKELEEIQDTPEPPLQTDTPPGRDDIVIPPPPNRPPLEEEEPPPSTTDQEEPTPDETPKIPPPPEEPPITEDECEKCAKEKEDEIMKDFCKLPCIQELLSRARKIEDFHEEEESGSRTISDCEEENSAVLAFSGNSFTGLHNRLEALEEELSWLRENVWCKGGEEQDLLLAVPTDWAMKPSSTIPRIAVFFAAEKDNGKVDKQNAWSLSIPHPSFSNLSNVSPPDYDRGNWRGELTLPDNTKIVASLETPEKARSYVKNLATSYVDSGWLPSDLDAAIKVSEQRGIKPATLKAFKVYYYPDGYQRTDTMEWEPLRDY